MIKSLIILFNTVSVFLFSFFFGDSPISIVGNFPKNVKPNTEFVAEIVIKKGTISSFAKFQMEVPQGFTVKEMDSKNGNFSFTNNIAKIIWTAVPAEADITLKFILITDPTVNGAQSISSKFSYVNNNEKAMVEMTPVEIMVGENDVVSSGNQDSSKTPENKTETPIVEQNTTTVSQPTELENEPN